MKYSLKNQYKHLLKEDLVDLSSITDDIGIAQVRLPDDSDKVRIYRVTANPSKTQITGKLEKEFDVTGIQGIKDKLTDRLKINAFKKNDSDNNYIKKTFENKIIQDVESLFINSYVNRNNIIFDIMNIENGIYKDNPDSDEQITMIDEQSNKVIDVLANLTNSFSDFMKVTIDAKINSDSKDYEDLSTISKQSGGKFDVLQSYQTKKSQSPRSGYFQEIVKDTISKQLNDEKSIANRVLNRINRNIRTIPASTEELYYDYKTGSLYFKSQVVKSSSEKLDDSKTIYLISLLHVITNLGTLDDYNSVQKVYDQAGDEVDKDVLATNIMREYSSEFNDAKLFSCIENIDIRKSYENIDEVIKVLNDNSVLFKEFSPANRIGRGEFACHLLFKTSNCFLPIEPDAVIETGSGTLKCSIKSFMSSGGTRYLSDAQTGTNMSSSIKSGYDNLLKSLLLIRNARSEAIIKQLCEDYFVFIAHLLSDNIKLTNDNIRNLTVKEEGKNFAIKSLLRVNNSPSESMSDELKIEYLQKMFDISSVEQDKNESTKDYLDKIRNDIKSKIQISDVKSKLASVKKAIVSEHDAKYVICFNNTDGAYEFNVDSGSTDRIAIKSVTESRTSFNITKRNINNSCRFTKGIEKIENALNSPAQQNNSYKRSGSLLKEVYSHLFKKKIINEGGLAGHMMHPYEALDMTPKQIIDRIKEYDTTQTIIEKVDGQNLFFTVELDGTLMFARNKQDMTYDDIIAKFTGHGAQKAFVEGADAIKSGVENWLSSAGPAAEMEIQEIFHPDGETKSFINFEIIHPEKSNQIKYDEKFIVFHSVVDYVNGRETTFSTNKGERLNKIVRLMDSGVNSSGFTLASNRTVNLNKLSNTQIEQYITRINDVMQKLDIDENEFLGDGIEKRIKSEIEKEGINISDEAAQILYDFVIYGETKSGSNIKSRDFTSMMNKEDVNKLRSIGLTTSQKTLKKVQHIISPFKDIFVDLGIDLLSGVKSAYMSDQANQVTIDTLRDKLQTAVDDLVRYMKENSDETWDPVVYRLMPHLNKVLDKGVNIIVSTAVEGGVYDHQGDLLKVTGGFAPLNQILGAAYRDNKGIFTTFKEKFMQQESNRRSLKSVFNLIF